MKMIQDESCGESNEHGHSVTIPENINESSLREAAGFYRDALGYAPHPLTGAGLNPRSASKAALRAIDDGHLIPQVAAVLYGKAADEVTAEERRAAKTVSLSLLYGQGVDGLKQSAAEQRLQLQPAEAESLHSTFLQHYEGLRKWHQSCRKKAAEGETEVRTLSGRRCLIPDDAGKWDRFTNLINTPVQAGCADGMKLALIALDRRLPHGSHLVLTVHDEIVVEVPDDDADSVAELVRNTMIEAMRSVFEEDVPFEVVVNIRGTWGG